MDFTDTVWPAAPAEPELDAVVELEEEPPQAARAAAAASAATPMSRRCMWEPPRRTTGCRTGCGGRRRTCMPVLPAEGPGEIAAVTDWQRRPQTVLDKRTAAAGSTGRVAPIAASRAEAALRWGAQASIAS